FLQAARKWLTVPSFALTTSQRGESLRSLERDFERMPVEAVALGAMVRGAGWQVADCYGKPFEQPFRQRSHLGVERQPVESPFRDGFDGLHHHLTRPHQGRVTRPRSRPHLTVPEDGW